MEAAPSHSVEASPSYSTALVAINAPATRSTETSEPTKEPSFDLFSTRRPRDLAAGTSSALKSLGKGVLAGAAGLVAAPFVGAQQEGIPGFCKGLGVGLVGAIALPVAGAAVGVAQIARGALNSHEAARESAQGKVWSEAKRQWVFYSLREEALEVLAGPAASGADGAGADGAQSGGAPPGGASGRGRAAAVRETELYDRLGVAPSASTGEIKKAYYQQARKLHPDKNPNDPDAKHNFQKVGEAYQILSDERLRVQYDRSGKEALGSPQLLDSTTFFAILFGSESFESLVGQLQLAMLFASDAADLGSEQLAARQRRREVLCAVSLAQLIAMFVAGDEVEFTQDMHAYAEQLAKSSFGDVLLHTIGCVYEGKAAEYFGDGAFAPLSTRLAKLRAQGHKASSAVKLARAGVRTYTVFKSLESRSASGENDSNLCARARSSPQRNLARNTASPRPDRTSDAAAVVLCCAACCCPPLLLLQRARGRTHRCDGAHARVGLARLGARHREHALQRVRQGAAG
jgi:DnaJ-domain-containing protein 1